MIAVRADAEPLAVWAADATLARSLGWPVPLPLLASELFARRGAGEGRRPRPGEAGWGKLVAFAAPAALAAFDLAQDLSRRAGRLMDAAPRLRAKGKKGAIEGLLADDAVPPLRHPRLERPRPAPPVRAAGALKRRARTHRPPDLPPVRALSAVARKPSPEPGRPRLFDLPAELRWREWKARVEAVLFAAAKPVGREVFWRAWSGATASSSFCWTT